jgi:hypothetical protein
MKIAKIAMETLGKLQSMPKGGKAAMLVGAGALLGGLAVDLMVGDSFEKEETKKPETAVVSNPNAQPKAEAKVEEKPEAQKEPEFEYVPPTVGKDGIAKADTTMYPGTQKIDYINYCDEKGRPVHTTYFTKDGKFNGFMDQTGDTSDFYNEAGKLRYRAYLDGDNHIEMACDYKGRWTTNIIDINNGRCIQEEDYDDGKKITHKYKYNSDGSYVATGYEWDTPTDQTTYDKTGKVIQEKRYDDDGQLKYTVKPKYNKEGDIVKRDTIPNS